MTVLVSKPPPLRASRFPPLDIAAGRVPGVSVVHLVGHDDAVGTTYGPVSIGGIYRTPQVAAATTLRIKAGDAADTAAGAGAREVTLVGLDETGAEVTEALATAGAVASSATSATFIRLYDVYVSASGTYATTAAGSHVGAIVVENSAGTEDWATISVTDFPRGQTQIGAYSVPLGKTAYVESVTVKVDNAKTADIIIFSRGNILETAAPYAGVIKLEFLAEGVADGFSLPSTVPAGPYPALTDIAFMAKVGTGTGHVTVEFELLLEDS